DALVLCHDATRTHLDGYPDYAIPPLGTCIDAYLEAGRLTNPGVRFAGVSLNTSGLDERTRRAAISRAEEETGLPVDDPLATGAAALTSAVLQDGRTGRA